MKRVRDLSVKVVRTWLRYYNGTDMNPEEQMKECHAGVRVVRYEAVRRCIEGAKDDVLRTACAATTQVLRAIHPPPTTNKIHHPGAEDH